MTPLIAPGSLIVSPFVTTNVDTSVDVPNFELVRFAPDEGQPHTGQLQHWYRKNQSPNEFWHFAQLINRDVPVTGPGAICHGSTGSKGNFEVVVPEGRGLAHYWRDNDRPETAWNPAGIIASLSNGPGAILHNRRSRDLEVTVGYGRDLVHFFRDGGRWLQTAQPVSRQALGPASMIQSSYGDNLELLVQEDAGIVLYWREWDAVGKPWKLGGVVTARATGAPAFIQGQFGSGDHTNFEAVVPVDDRLELRWRDNSPSGGMTWRSGGTMTQQAGPVNAVAMTRGPLFDQLDIVTQECSDSLFQYYRFPEITGERVVMRNACLRIDEGPLHGQMSESSNLPQRSFKVNQLTGLRDARTGDSTFSDTQANILGTDLGASVEHGDKLYFLFGDTAWVPEAQPVASDSIAYTRDTEPESGVRLHFRKSHLEVRFPGRPALFDPHLHGQFDVPLDGFSFCGQLFVFFSTDNFADGKVMGRSVLARSDEPVPKMEDSTPSQPLSFHYVTEFSRYRFINVSVQPVTAADSRNWKLPDGHEGLLIWGTGAYRMDHVYLAFMPLDTDDAKGDLLGDNALGGLLGGVRYFRGLDAGQPQWSLDERDAVPLFHPAAIGELSVRWNAMLRAFVLLYMSGPEDPIGSVVQLRLSRTPWGPWSDRRVVFDWVLDGKGYRQDSKRGFKGYRQDSERGFIHRSTDEALDDGLSDDLISWSRRQRRRRRLCAVSDSALRAKRRQGDADLRRPLDLESVSSCADATSNHGVGALLPAGRVAHHRPGESRVVEFREALGDQRPSQRPGC